ncbi:unnamed protein product [Symbiodinium pilosum]|uniref:Uncharacterized protein n=1 Tax=Symbiodinium pilosum TaxID=2952 RepID=A0A812N538_SYMPI|nr:unnamed protein product [Symbiodinium pilosum]
MRMSHGAGYVCSGSTSSTESEAARPTFYGSWKLQHGIATNQAASLHLERTDLAYGQAWWAKPGYSPKAVIAGCCLLDCRWRMEFRKLGRGTPPASKPLARKHHREEAVARLLKGQKVARILVPTTLGEYHLKLIKWQMAMLKELQVEEVFYHYPTEEYHFWIREVEVAAGRRLPEQHDLLDSFAAKVMQYVQAHAPASCKLHFIEPMKTQNLESPVESFLWPYLSVQSLTDCFEVAAFEDLLELRLGEEAFQRTGRRMPTLCVVIDEDHPFYRNGEKGCHELLWAEP